MVRLLERLAPAQSRRLQVDRTELAQDQVVAFFPLSRPATGLAPSWSLFHDAHRQIFPEHEHYSIVHQSVRESDVQPERCSHTTRYSSLSIPSGPLLVLRLAPSACARPGYPRTNQYYCMEYICGLTVGEHEMWDGGALSNSTGAAPHLIGQFREMVTGRPCHADMADTDETDSESVEPCRPTSVASDDGGCAGLLLLDATLRRIIWATRTRDVFNHLTLSIRPMRRPPSAHHQFMVRASELRPIGH